jgi:hypothetical protein
VTEELHQTFESLGTDSAPRDSLVNAIKVKTDVDGDRAREVIEQGLSEGVLEQKDGEIIYQETLGDGGAVKQQSDKYADVPEMLKDRDIWLLWDSSADRPKRPHWRGDFHVSWSDPEEWHSFEEAVEAASQKESWGIGYVNTYNNDDYPQGVITTIDIDGGLDSDGRLKDWVPQLEAFEDAYIEVSPSGNGLHIPVIGYDAPEWWRDTQFNDSDHEGVDVLSNKFCTVTGETFFGSGEEPADPQGGINRWLAEVYREIEGHLPGKTEPSGESGEDLDLSDEQIDEALSHIDPDCSYGEWRDIGFALVNHYGPGKKAHRKFDQWSRGGSKYNEEGTKRHIKNIAEESKADGGVTVGTLIHRAKQAGWEPDFGNEHTNGEHKGSEGNASESIPSFDIADEYRLQLIPVSGDEARIVVKNGDNVVYSETKEKGAWKSRQVRQKVASSAAEQAPEGEQETVKSAVKSGLIDAISEEESDPERWTELMRDEDTQELIERTENVVVYPDEDGAVWVIDIAPPGESPKDEVQAFEFDGGQLNNNSPTPFENEYLEKFLVRTELGPAAWDELTEYWIEEAEPKEPEVDVDKEAFIEDILDDLNSGGFTCVDWTDRFDAFDWGARKAIYASGGNGFDAVDEDAVLVPGTYISEKKEDVNLEFNLSKELRERGVVLTTSKRVRGGPDQQQRRVWVFDADKTLFADGENLYSPDDEPDEEVEV